MYSFDTAKLTFCFWAGRCLRSLSPVHFHRFLWCRGIIFSGSYLSSYHLLVFWGYTLPGLFLFMLCSVVLKKHWTWLPEFKSWFYYLLAVWPWTGYLTSLASVFSSESGMIINRSNVIELLRGNHIYIPMYLPACLPTCLAIPPYIRPLIPW